MWIMGNCASRHQNNNGKEENSMATTRKDPDAAWTEAVNEALINCKELRINFLALDFDQTIVDVHTYGNWKGTADELKHHVRPMFRHLIPAALDQGFHIGVVTFSAQVDLIRTILEQLVGADRAASIPIRGGYPGHSFVYEGQGSTQGKQAHMASAAEELEERNKGLEVSKTTTVLIDDDAKNIRFALQHGVRAIWLNPNKTNQLMKDMKNLV